MLRVALLLTGELRTLQETHKSILLNLIEPNMADVFIHYAQQSYKEKNSVFDPSTFGKLWGQEAVKKVACWSAADDKEHEFYRQQVAQVKPCTSKLTANRNYLLYGSGTLYEYTQVLKCAQLMTQYEQEHNLKYDIVLRARLDMMFFKPFPVRTFFQHNDISRLSMTDIVSLQLPFLQQKQAIKMPETGLEGKALDFPAVWTLRKNMLWIASRKRVFSLLYGLIHFYGDYYDASNPHWCWDSESQFSLHCKAHDILHIDYHSDVEEHYLRSRSANRLTTTAPSEVDERLVFTVCRPASYQAFAEP